MPSFTPRGDGSFLLVLAKRGAIDAALPNVSFPDNAPEILVPLRCEYTARGKEYTLPRGCAQLLSNLGLRPRFLLPGLHRPSAYPNATGALYLGGADLDPVLYGARQHPKTEPTELARDALEITLLHERILPQRMPFFGICRGIQALAVGAGGTLHQHIPDVDVTYDHAGTATSDATHRVETAPGSRCATLLGNSVVTNSHHHQAVATPGYGMRIAGRTPDGIVELLEATDPAHWCVATQSHPERDVRDDLAPLLSDFLAAVHSRHNV